MSEDLRVLCVDSEKIELSQEYARICAHVCLSQIVADVEISRNCYLMSMQARFRTNTLHAEVAEQGRVLLRAENHREQASLWQRLLAAAVADLIELTRLSCALYKPLLFGEELSHSLLRILLPLKDLAILLIEDLLRVRQLLNELGRFSAIWLGKLYWSELRQRLISEDQPHLLWLYLSLLYCRLVGLVFQRAYNAGLGARASVTGGIRVNLLLVFIDDTRGQHLITETKILVEHKFRGCFGQVRFSIDKRVLSHKLGVILVEGSEKI